MSVTINIHGQSAVLADGEWRSASVTLREHLNLHLESVQHEIPGHWPDTQRELEAAHLAVATFGGKLVDANAGDQSSPRTPDGNLTVF